MLDKRCRLIENYLAAQVNTLGGKVSATGAAVIVRIFVGIAVPGSGAQRNLILAPSH